MIGLDTNVLVRYVAQDDEKQSAIASEFIEALTPAAPGFLALVSIVELVWVLQSSYKASKEEVITVLETLLRTRELNLENAEIIWQAIRRFSESNADFAECLIERSAHAAGCDHTVTFDSKAARTAGMQRLS